MIKVNKKTAEGVGFFQAETLNAKRTVAIAKQIITDLEGAGNLPDGCWLVDVNLEINFMVNDET